MRGGRANPHLDEEMSALQLSAEEKSVPWRLTFLRSLSGDVYKGRRRALEPLANR